MTQYTRQDGSDSAYMNWDKKYVKHVQDWSDIDVQLHTVN